MKTRPTPAPAPLALVRLGLLAAALSAGVLPEVRASDDSPPSVATEAGLLRGRHLDDGQASVFKGIPFAAPPVGALRWKAPQPAAPWTGTRDALLSGPPAAQPDLGWNSAMAAHSQEDCLYLDVWTPELRPKAALPVMVWFHGGANIAGSAGFDPAYDGVALISRGVILVVAEYRLGIFGFLAHPELARESEHGSSGNYAVLDQIAALKWVQANIAGFGGDPANVTIFGQSAGATDVAALLATPLSEGLFSRAVSESGDDSPAQTRSRDRAETAGVEMARRLGAPASGSLAYLRSLSTADLLKARSSMGHFTVDGWVFPKSPYEVWRDGAARQVPLIIGTNAVELPTPGSPDDLRQAIERELGDLAPKAFALYGLAPGSPAKSPDPVYGDTAAQWGSDAWRSLSILHGEWLSRSGTAVWEYEFDRGIPPNPRATHSGDLPYVFGNFNAKSGNLAGAYTDVDHALSDKVQTYWTNFAKTGNPNGEGAPLWPAYTVAGRAFMRFGMDGQVAAEADQRGPTMALFRDRAKSPDTIP